MIVACTTTSPEPEAFSVIPRTPESGEAARVTVVDPMSDIASIVEDALGAGLDPRQLAFVSVHMRFAERASWEHAAKTAVPAWEVAAYSATQGHMLRLSRKAHPTARSLAKVRSDALRFADANGADWVSMSIEDLQQAPTSWQTLTSQAEIRLPEPRTSPEAEADVEALMMQQGGTA